MFTLRNLVPSLIGLSLFAIAAEVCADVFFLKTGGQIDGTLIDRGSEGEYVIKNATGVVITLERNQVKDVKEEDKIDKEYERRSRTMPQYGQRTPPDGHMV